MKAQNKSIIVVGETLQDTYIWKRYLFGAIKLKEIIRTDSIKTDLFIETDRKINDIYLNGERIFTQASIE